MACLTSGMFGAASVCHAQAVEPGLEFSAFAGRLFGGSLGADTNALFATEVQVADAATFGARAACKPKNRLEVRAHFSTSSTSFVAPDDRRLFDGGGSQTAGDVRLSYILGYTSVRLGQRGSDFLPDVRSRNGCARAGRVPRPGRAVRFDAHYYATWLPISRCPSSFRCDQTQWLSNGDATGGFLVALF